MGNHKIEIRRNNVEKILLGAEKVFAEKGYAGTAMADIAEEVQLPRSNLHYYFSTKHELYSAVLLDLLEVWKQDALCFEMFDDPRVVLSSYIRAKMQHSRSRPLLPVEPSALLYMIWASTQHYADFDHQVNILNDHQPLSDLQFERAVQTVTSVTLRGIGLEP
ncbi:TetR family transcriptional regulator [Pseudomonas sp. ABAC61]|nr:TetR family transcriptional regulator [Pseudomonas sp. ABAC61]